MTSLAFRTLSLELAGFEADPSIPATSLALLQNAFKLMQEYLLGEDHLAHQLRNHAVLWTKTTSALRSWRESGQT